MALPAGRREFVGDAGREYERGDGAADVSDRHSGGRGTGRPGEQDAVGCPVTRISVEDARQYFRNEGLPEDRVNPSGYAGVKELLTDMVLVQIHLQKRENPLDLSGEAYGS